MKTSIDSIFYIQITQIGCHYVSYKHDTTKVIGVAYDYETYLPNTMDHISNRYHYGSNLRDTVDHTN